MQTRAGAKGPAIVAFGALVLLVSGCGDAMSPRQESQPGMAHPEFAEAGGTMCHGYVEPGCTTTFTANPGNYTCLRDCGGLPPQTDTVTVVFSRPVYHLTVTGSGAYDCGGTFGEVTAYDPAGQAVERAALQVVDVGDCRSNGLVFYWASAVSATLQYSGPIARITMSPMSPLEWEECVSGGEPNPEPGGDPNPPPDCRVLRALAYYGYDFQEHPPCPATGDSLLDADAVRAGLLAALTASHPDRPPGSRIEVGGLIWRRADGTFFTGLIPPGPTTTECHFDGDFAEGVRNPPEPGAVAIGKFHTHPALAGDSVYGCPSTGRVRMAQFPGDRGVVPIARPDQNGGGSNPDWDSGTSDGYPLYVINAAAHVYRLDPNTPPERRAGNPNRWELTEPGASCFRRMP